MELSQNDFLEELLAPMRRESSNYTTTTSWSNSSVNTFSSHVGDNCDQPFFQIQTTNWGFDSFEENPILEISPSSSNPSPFLGFSTLLDDHDHQSCPLIPTTHHDHYPNFVVDTIIPSSHNQEDHYNPQNSLVIGDDHDHNQGFDFKCTNINGHVDDVINSCKVELVMLDQQNQLPQQGYSEVEMVDNPSFNIGVCGDNIKKKGIRSKKMEGQPSKNLMAERRRRKRLNDRLSMLRSIVPKISKMDRTSILGDTIDYMKELLERINKLQEGIEESTNEQVNLLGISKEVKPNEVMVRNSPKFEVDRREMDTRIDICCAAKPGLLLSTMKTIEAVGLEIQQCVISCFNDFSLQASCSEGSQQRTLISCEDIKEAIFRNAGYGGRCL